MKLSVLHVVLLGALVLSACGSVTPSPTSPTQSHTSPIPAEVTVTGTATAGQIRIDNVQQPVGFDDQAARRVVEVISRLKPAQRVDSTARHSGFGVH